MLRQKDYPRAVVVGDSVWNVRFVRRIPDDQREELLGLCDPETQTLYVKTGQTPLGRLDTFIHELVHAFEDEYEMEIPHPAVYKLGAAFAAFLAVNYGPVLKPARRPSRPAPESAA